MAQQVANFDTVNICSCILYLYLTWSWSGEQVDHPARGRGRWQLYAGPTNPSASCQQGCGQPCQVKLEAYNNDNMGMYKNCQHIIMADFGNVLNIITLPLFNKRIEFSGLGGTRSTLRKTWRWSPRCQSPWRPSRRRRTSWWRQAPASSPIRIPRWISSNIHIFPGEYSQRVSSSSVQWVDEKIGLGGVMWVLTLTASLALISPQPRPYHCNPLQHTTLKQWDRTKIISKITVNFFSVLYIMKCSLYTKSMP